MLALMVSGCTKETEEDDSSYVDIWEDEEEDQEEEQKDDIDEERDSDEEKQEASDENEKKKSRSLQLQVANHSDQEWIEDNSNEYGYTVMCNVSWQNLILEEESAKAYPKLAEALEKRNQELDEYYLNVKEDLLASATEIYEYRDEYYTPLNSNSSFYVQRADEHILSIREDASDYWGGAHGMYGSVGINYDVNTGEILELTDVLTNIETLPSILSEKVIREYAGEYETFETLEETLENYSTKEYCWTMGYEGITFYFQPYEIASYAMGLIKANIGFDEMPELFQKEYTQIPEEGYCVALSMYQELELDLDVKDGIKNRLWLSEHYDSEEEIEYGIKRLSITLDDMVYVEPDTYGFEINPYLVCVGDKDNKKYYLYVETISENDYGTLSVYDLNQGEITLSGKMFANGFGGSWKQAEGEDAVYYQNLLLNPQEVQLVTKLDILGSWWGVKNYTVSEDDGMPQTDDEYYEIKDNTLATTSVIPLEVKMLPLRNNKELPEGTNFYAIRTDGETYVDWRLDDGKECRIYVERDDWNLKINGIDQYECFEMLWYAG